MFLQLTFHSFEGVFAGALVISVFQSPRAFRGVLLIIYLPPPRPIIVSMVSMDTKIMVSMILKASSLPTWSQYPPASFFLSIGPLRGGLALAQVFSR